MPGREHVEAPGLIWLYKRIDELGYRSLSEFSEKCGINKGNLHRYFSESTKPSVAALPALCSALETDVGELLSHLGVEISSYYLAHDEANPHNDGTNH